MLHIIETIVEKACLQNAEKKGEFPQPSYRLALVEEKCLFEEKGIHMLMKKLARVSAMFALCVFFVLTMLTSMGSVHAQRLQPRNVSSQTVNSAGPYGPDTCKQGYVWREAIPSDHVCVTPDQRDRVTQDNAAASSRRDPTGAYGSDTCKQGYVWREAFTNDHVCVTPDERTRVAQDNSQAANRVAK